MTVNTNTAGNSRTASSARLDASKRYCLNLTRTSARNFYYGMRLLPEPKRSAMFALYAYMRLVDDIADREDGRSALQRKDELEAWREQTRRALVDDHLPATADDAIVWPAFADVVRRYAIPVELFDAAIAGQQQDVEPVMFETFASLHEYCHRVAGVVGIASLHIWGFKGGEETERMAIALGVAFQLTNILRDLREDSARGRLYLPLEDLKAAGLNVFDCHALTESEPFDRLMQIELERARHHYRLAEGLELRIPPDCRPSLIAMTEIYARLFAKISAAPAIVLQRRVTLSTWSKFRIGWRAARAYRAAGASSAIALDTR